ncbi:MAG TPA: response regulator [Spirochaetota bacterium]|nr:response regulator [Spirochaetota bacterium]
MARIMIVEDDPLISDDLKNCLTKAGHSITSIETKGESAFFKAQQNNPDVVLMDIRLAGVIDGIESATVIKKRYNIPIIFLTAFSNEKYLTRSQNVEAIDYIVKPYDENYLLKKIDLALGKK